MNALESDKILARVVVRFNERLPCGLGSRFLKEPIFPGMYAIVMPAPTTPAEKFAALARTYASTVLNEAMARFFLDHIDRCRSVEELDAVMTGWFGLGWRSFARTVAKVKAGTICAAAYDALSNPHTRFGRKRLRREFEELAAA